MIYLLATTNHGRICAWSMQHFDCIDDLRAQISTKSPQYWSAGITGRWNAYRIRNDGRRAMSLSLKEYRAIGMRPPAEDRKKQK
jgi:hypothetical protein